MYSINGRIKNEKAAASTKKERRHVLVCKMCGHKMPNKSKEFGEKIFCDKCDSDELFYMLDQ